MSQVQKRKQQTERQTDTPVEIKQSSERDKLLDEVDEMLEGLDAIIEECQVQGEETCGCGKPLTDCFWTKMGFT